ncbi:hypothetical protein HED34_02855 [Vagococcus fluvialis]|uniref:hypothetical protein n=1 Tax=Vagococcus fluvialis TaxID=2738 RepID=UPI001432F9B0|nr:hypothetical protein [Vagococcus fluvialis]NKC58900.1 hypothetical protein [Vagococcus fluvialis]NKD49654.1 hypothetical protein [Vagococcus fluvialis]
MKGNKYLYKAAKETDLLLFEFVRYGFKKNDVELTDKELNKLIAAEEKGISHKLNNEIMRMSDYGASLTEIKKVVVPLFVTSLKISMKSADFAIKSTDINELRKEIFETDIFDNYIAEFLELLSNVRVHEQLKGGEES